jgi:hypothetical protein
MKYSNSGYKRINYGPMFAQMIELTEYMFTGIAKPIVDPRA